MREPADLGGISRRARAEAGQVLIIVAVMLPVLIGFMGLVIDLGSLYHHKRRMQTAADAGALAGAHERLRGRTVEIENSALEEAGDNDFSHGIDGVDVTVSHPPVSGYYINDPIFVEVIIRQSAPTHFMRIFGWQEVPIDSRAVAGAAASSKNCVYVLDPGIPGALQGDSNSVLNATCGVSVNSNSPTAMSLNSSANVTAGEVAITGDYELTSSASVSPTPTTGVTASADPLAYMNDPLQTTPPPIGGRVPERTNYVRDSGTHVLFPGTYCGGIELNNDARGILSPGFYVLLGGGLRLTSSASIVSIEAAGVTFYNTEGAGFPYQPIKIESNTVVDLKAPTTGPYAGMLFWQDPEVGRQDPVTGLDYVNRFESSSDLVLEGALYFPDQILRLESNTSTLARYSIVVVRQLLLESSANLIVQSDYSGLPEGASPIKRLSLVE